MGIEMELTGDKHLDAVFRELVASCQEKVLRPAVTAGSTPVLREARKDVEVESGLLKKALGKKVKSYKQSHTVVAIVGARKGVVGEYKGKKRWPVKYSHLVENGHINEDGTHVPAKPFMRPAYDRTKQESKEIVKGKIVEGITKQVKSVPQ